MKQCRCLHRKEAHVHYSRSTACAIRGCDCPRLRWLWVPRDRFDHALSEGDPVRLGGFTHVIGYIVRVMSSTEALVYWGGHNLSITESVKLEQLSRDHEKEVSA